MSIEIEKTETLYKGWNSFSLAIVKLADGTRIARTIEDHGRATAVLAYDAERRVALLVRQFRAPVYVASQAPDLLEAIAGMLEAGDARSCARREAMEEAGLKLTALEPAGIVWTTPGISTERIHLFLATYSEKDRIADGGGLAAEHENIAVAEVELAELARMADHGEITDLKTFALVQTLRLRRPELFA